MFDCEIAGHGGHKIESLRIEEFYEPLGKVTVGKFNLLCIRCGKSLEQVSAGKKVRRSKKDKASTLPDLPDVSLPNEPPPNID